MRVRRAGWRGRGYGPLRSKVNPLMTGASTARGRLIQTFKFLKELNEIRWGDGITTAGNVHLTAENCRIVTNVATRGRQRSRSHLLRRYRPCRQRS